MNTRQGKNVEQAHMTAVIPGMVPFTFLAGSAILLAAASGSLAALYTAAITAIWGVTRSIVWTKRFARA